MSSSHPVARPARLRMANALVSRLLAISPRTADLALAVVLVLATMNFGAGGTPPNSVSDTLLLMAGAATVAVRRRWPLAVLIATLVPYAAAPTTTPGEPAVLVALYTVASLRSQRTAVLAAGLAATVSVVAVFVHGMRAWRLPAFSRFSPRG